MLCVVALHVLSKMKGRQKNDTTGSDGRSYSYRVFSTISLISISACVSVRDSSRMLTRRIPRACPTRLIISRLFNLDKITPIAISIVHEISQKTRNELDTCNPAMTGRAGKIAGLMTSSPIVTRKRPVGPTRHRIAECDPTASTDNYDSIL